MTLREAVGKVLEGWTLPNAVRKILEDAYFAETQRQWIGLTNEEMKLIDPDGFEDNLPQMIQQALKEKNT